MKEESEKRKKALAKFFFVPVEALTTCQGPCRYKGRKRIPAFRFVKMTGHKGG